jgi:hypothetical protein
VAEKLEFWYEPDRDNQPTPHTYLAFNDDLIELTWDNTTIYTHQDKHRSLDHLFYTENDDLGATALRGYYLFRQKIDNFDLVVMDLDSYDFPHIHSPKILESDLNAFIVLNSQDLEDE